MDKDKMVEINCIVCEQPIKLPLYSDAEDYDGQIFCNKCNLLLHVRLKSFKLKKYKVIREIEPKRTNVNFIIGQGYPDDTEDSPPMDLSSGKE